MGAGEIFVKVNTDAAYRARFLKDPVGVLRGEGIILSADQQKQLADVINSVKVKLPRLGNLPSDYKALMEGEMNLRGGGQMLIV